MEIYSLIRANIKKNFNTVYIFLLILHYYATDSLLYLYKNKLSFMNFFTNLLRMQTNKKKIVFKLFLYVAFFITFPSLVYCQVSIKRYFLFDTLKKKTCFCFSSLCSSDGGFAGGDWHPPPLLWNIRWGTVCINHVNIYIHTVNTFQN